MKETGQTSPLSTPPPRGSTLKSLETPELHVRKLRANLQQLLNSERLTLPQFVGRYWDLRETNPKAAFVQTVPAQSALATLRHVFFQLDALAPLFLPTASVGKLAEKEAPDALNAFAQSAWKEKKQSIQ